MEKRPPVQLDYHGHPAEKPVTPAMVVGVLLFYCCVLAWLILVVYVLVRSDLMK